MKQKALYAGSFDPITNGHLDLISRASKLYDKLVVGVIANPSKNPLFTVEERKALIKEATTHLENVEVDDFTGLLAEYVNEKQFNVVVRGLRATTDFESEMQMAQMNARLYDEKVETIFLMTSPDFSFVSSSMIKEVFMLNGSIEGLVPPQILDYMKKKFR
ncbi:pantetheine-phosphate adenylyltransferase [Clostridium aminobutyricum]|uniref:Phosphopantetheine adenylyltransferase n=1 Tax=Clostridium aminobutyricum TaxID=33953 RepID=A0A939D869_CLOAM|nr:pantetheine-phosphate adenylyltransferase [Clostridium aminobutyricum]MBN7772568.1 pantetheine-phosphate adenylyltransferase [Clostridium aminobutyricum]